MFLAHTPENVLLIMSKFLSMSAFLFGWTPMQDDVRRQCFPNGHKNPHKKTIIICAC